MNDKNIISPTDNAKYEVNSAADLTTNLLKDNIILPKKINRKNEKNDNLLNLPSY